MPTMTKETHWSVYNVVSSARSDVTFLPPATNLRQGNIFTRMWQGGAWWGGAWVAGGIHGRSAYWQGRHVWQGVRGGGHAWKGECMVGGMHGRRAYIAGGHEWWGMGVRENGNCSRLYASYWNAFL